GALRIPHAFHIGDDPLNAGKLSPNHPVDQREISIKTLLNFSGSIASDSQQVTNTRLHHYFLIG
ncbi:hypothetical protein, partial [Schleiferia thermophila]